MSDEEWDFGWVKDLQSIDLVKAVFDWEFAREAYRNDPSCLDWFFRDREKGIDVAECHGLTKRLWMVSDEFPEKPVISLGLPEIESRLKGLPKTISMSGADASLVRISMKDTEGAMGFEMNVMPLLDQSIYLPEADAYLYENFKEEKFLLYPARIDLRMSKKAIIGSYEKLLDTILEKVGDHYSPVDEKGKSGPLSKMKDRLGDLSAFRLKRMLEPQHGKGWAAEAYVLAPEVSRSTDKSQWDKKVKKAEKEVAVMGENLRRLDLRPMLQKKFEELSQMAKELEISDFWQEEDDDISSDF